MRIEKNTGGEVVIDMEDSDYREWSKSMESGNRRTRQKVILFWVKYKRVTVHLDIR